MLQSIYGPMGKADPAREPDAALEMAWLFGEKRRSGWVDPAFPNATGTSGNHLDLDDQ